MAPLNVVLSLRKRFINVIVVQFKVAQLPWMIAAALGSLSLSLLMPLLFDPTTCRHQSRAWDSGCTTAFRLSLQSSCIQE